MPDDAMDGSWTMSPTWKNKETTGSDNANTDRFDSWTILRGTNGLEKHLGYGRCPLCGTIGVSLQADPRHHSAALNTGTLIRNLPCHLRPPWRGLRMHLRRRWLDVDRDRVIVGSSRRW